MIRSATHEPAVLSFQNPDAPIADTTMDKWGQLPELASTFEEVDGLFYLTTGVIIFFFLLILALLVYSVVRYRRKTLEQPAASTVTHHTMLEVVWTVIPLIIVMVIFAWGWEGSLRMTVAPYEAVRNEYKVVGKQWSWSFTHPGDTTGVDNELWVVLNKPASFMMESQDVLHSFFVPAMRVKRDLVPGRYQSVWFTPTKLGTFRLFCTEYCGKDHSAMIGYVHVVTADDYAKRPWDTRPDLATATPEEIVAYGEKLTSTCKACHSVDGSALVGPSFKDLWGKQEEMNDGTVETVNLDYLTRSLRDPNSQIVKGTWSGNMTPYDEGSLSDDDIRDFLVPYLQSLQSDETLKAVK